MSKEQSLENLDVEMLRDTKIDKSALIEFLDALIVEKNKGSVNNFEKQ